jgi:DNA topoisomerase-1
MSATLTRRQRTKAKKPATNGKAAAPPETDPIQSAKAAGLHYVTDSTPGIQRKRAGKGFKYLRPDGKPVRDEETLWRIKALAIPPAWKDVWISPDDLGHLQAVGFDARGRKQYRYHPKWRQVRDETKYERMVAFAKALPAIRARVQKDLKLPGMPREKVLAALVRLLETTLIRVGNDEYAQENKSYGLTTIHNDHVAVRGARIKFEFRGKSGVEHEIDLEDRRLAGIVRKCQELPGQELFAFADHAGHVHDVKSDDVNQYLKEIAGEDFTAKDFRTWAGTVLAAMALEEFQSFESKAQAKKNIVRAVEEVAKKLGNTKAVCRKCYVHPAIFDAYMDGTLIEVLRKKAQRKLAESAGDLRPEEAAVMGMLENRLARESGTRK